MRGDDRLTRNSQDVVEGLVRNVRNIDDHADSVHLTNDLFTEIREPIMFRFPSGRVCPIVAAKMGQSHGQNAEAAIHTKNAEIVIDLMATLRGKNSCDLLLSDDSLNILCTRSKFDLVRVLIKHA